MYISDGENGYPAEVEAVLWSLTRLMHRFPEDRPFETAMQVAELDYIASS